MENNEIKIKIKKRNFNNFQFLSDVETLIITQLSEVIPNRTSYTDYLEILQFLKQTNPKIGHTILSIGRKLAAMCNSQIKWFSHDSMRLFAENISMKKKIKIS